MGLALLDVGLRAVLLPGLGPGPGLGGLVEVVGPLGAAASLPVDEAPPAAGEGPPATPPTLQPRLLTLTVIMLRERGEREGGERQRTHRERRERERERERERGERERERERGRERERERESERERERDWER